MRAFALLVAVLAVAVVGVSADAWTAIDPSYSVNSIVPSLNAAPITFTPSGDLILVDSRFSPPCLFRFPNAVSTPFGATIPFAYASTCELSGGHSVLGASGSDIVVTAAGRLYQSTGQELSLSNYTVARVAFSNCGAAHGIALDPTDGSLFISNYGTRRVYKVPNPDTHPGTQILDCNAPFFDAGAQINSGIDGLTVGPDGTLYMAAYDIASLAVVSSAGQLIGVKGTGQAAGFGPDGISICIGDGNSFAMTSTANRGQIIKFNLTGPGGAPTYGTSTVATNGATGYLDWTVVDPKGCIWGTTMSGPNGVYRISNADGSCPNCNAPQVPPSTSCPNCSDAVHVAFSASEAAITATANSAGSCVSLVFDS